MAERKHILLAAINAKYIHSNLAVYSLKAYAKKYQDQIGLAEYTINQNPDDILKGIYRDHPEVLCISCYIWNISYVKNLIREVHKVLPDTAIWLGGPEVSYDARKVLEEHPEVTGVMKGEGEVTFLELAGFYLEGISELAKIEGITFCRYFFNCIVSSHCFIMPIDSFHFNQVYQTFEGFFSTNRNNDWTRISTQNSFHLAYNLKEVQSSLFSWPLSRQGLLEDLEWADFWKQSVQTL